MGIAIGSNFDMQAALPLDSRDVVADNTARNAIPSGVRFLGMKVTVISPNMVTYVLKDGITNANWEIDGTNPNAVLGPASSNVGDVAVYNSTDGKSIKITNVNIDTSDNMTGVNELDAAQVMTEKLVMLGGIEKFVTTDSTTTGSNATVNVADLSVIRFTNASLVSISQLSGIVQGQELTFINATGAPITFNDESGATAAFRIHTGTKGPLVLNDQATISGVYGDNSRFQVVGGTGAGGSSSLDTVFQLTAQEVLTDWDITAIQSGTFVKETVAPFNGLASYKFTRSTSSSTAIILSPAKDVAVRFRGQTCTLYFPYSYNGLNGIATAQLYDATNAAFIPGILALDGTNGGIKIARMNATIPLTCTSVRVVYTFTGADNSKVLQFDDVQLTSDTTIMAPIFSPDSTIRLTVANGYGSTATKIRRFSTVVEQVGSAILYQDSATNGASFTILEKGIYDISFSDAFTTTGYCGISINSASLTTNVQDLVNPAERPAIGFNGVATAVATCAWSGELAVGTIIRPHTSGNAASGNMTTFTISKNGKQTNSIVSAPETFNSDTASFNFLTAAQATVATLGNFPIGSYITCLQTGGGNTRTQNSTRPTQTDADMNINGINIAARAYSGTSTAGLPSVFIINIGKGLSGREIDVYKSVGRTNGNQLGLPILDGTFEEGIRIIGYDSNTGLLTIDAGYRSGTTSTARFVFADGTTQTSGYLVIKASKSPALTAVPVMLEKVATISDVKTNTTAGGAATSGAYQTRTLNTVSDPFGIVTSLTANQFTLQAGEYYIEASAPAVRVDQHKAKLRNITDSTDTIIGTAEYSTSTAGSGSSSIVRGNLLISSAKTFEIQHRVGTTQATFGYGFAASFGDVEIYTQVKITKIR